MASLPRMVLPNDCFEFSGGGSADCWALGGGKVPLEVGLYSARVIRFVCVRFVNGRPQNGPI